MKAILRNAARSSRGRQSFVHFRILSTRGILRLQRTTADESESPWSRPKRANAGALMVTTLALNRRKSEPAEKKEKSPVKPRQPAKPKKLVWPGKAVSKSTEVTITEAEMVTSRKSALSVIACIPDSICHSRHHELLQQHQDWFDEKEMNEIKEFILKLKPQIDSATKKLGLENYLKRLARRKKQLQDQVVVPAPAEPIVEPVVEPVPEEEAKTEKIEVPVVPKPAPTKEATIKPKPSSSRRKYEEDEKADIIKLENQQIMVDGQVLNIDHENYIRETDVELPYDDHIFPEDIVKEEKEENVENIAPVAMETEPVVEKQPCMLEHCKLGCVCPSSDASRPETKAHCGKLNCMFECTCNALGWSEDAGIRSRLRPRVSLLNWNYRLNYMDAFINDKEKDSTSKNRSDAQGQGRLKRHIVPPKRNNDFVSHSGTKKVNKLQAAKNQAKLSYNKLRSRLNLKPFARTLKTSNAKDKISKPNRKIIRPSNFQKSENKKTVAHLSARPTKATKKVVNPKNAMKASAAKVLSPRQISSGKSSKPLVEDVDYSLKGTGPLIPADILARFAPFFEIQYQPKPDRYLPLLSDSESSDDDENDEDTIFLSYMSTTQQSVAESSFPVIVSYQSCCPEPMLPENVDASA